ncbi:endonuclease I [Christiangramia gaetbulicola]|uniref:Endonuclease I n=1 Tax=Christiangramia gaetbulicola TaxID=703340 RepID=A0A2T6AMY3_9FLAO|nr:Ig-like domain-containing protein [Christiangramia gaetbulicola]PTX45182.1 endonuclease I [Christiangramia gaetbulicola]
MKKYIYLVLITVLLGCSSDENPAPKPDPTPGTGNPEAVNDAFNARENQQLKISLSDLTSNDNLVDNARVSDFDNETVEGGTITDNRDGSITYDPPTDYIGEDSFSYDLCVPGDDSRCSSAMVTLTVTDAGDPVANNDAYTINEDQDLVIRNYLENDELLDAAATTEVKSESGNATVVLNEDGSISYTPNEGFSGEDSFTYTICDSDETPSCSTATINMTVLDEGDPVANDDTVVITTTATEVVIDKMLNNDEVIDDAEIVSIDLDGASGTAELNADGTITYKPSAGFKGDDSFTYTLCDDDAEPTCVTATITVSVVEPVSFNIPASLADYYNDVAFTQDPELLYEELSGFTTTMHTNRLEYYQRHDYLYDADEDPANPNNVILMYSGESRPEDEYQVGDLNAGETFNTEHIYPQSRLSSEEAKNDMHHMRAADVDVNSERLNFPFTDGSGDFKLVNDNSWFPGDDWRGDVARMVMYVNLRYGEDFVTVGGLDLFLEWNIEDPVSEFEIQRNNVIYAAQGNRNPFIDNPFLATLIWGGDDAENRWE